MDSEPERLEGLRRSLRCLEMRLDGLATRLTELGDENAALRECLYFKGALPAQAFLARLHRRRFARVLRQHPLRRAAAAVQGNCGRAGLEELARARELALLTAGLAGSGCAQPLAAASHALASSVADVAPDLSKLQPLALYAVGGAARGRGPLPSVERLCPPSACVAAPAAPLAAPRAVCAAVAMAGQLYVIAGRGADGAALATVECYDPQLNAWQAAPTLLQARGWVAAARAGCGVCVLGGEDDITLDVAERLDLGDTCWKPLPPMHSPRWAAAAASAGGHVYVAGGHHNDGEVLDSFERLPLRCGMGEWEPLPPMHCRRAAFALAALGGCLYAVGGYDEQERGLRSLERFDPSGPGAWEVLTPMAAPRWGLGAVGCGGLLYVLGGTTGNGLANVGVVKRYSPEADAWESVGRLLIARRCCGVAACPSRSS